MSETHEQIVTRIHMCGDVSYDILSGPFSLSPQMSGFSLETLESDLMMAATNGLFGRAMLDAFKRA